MINVDEIETICDFMIEEGMDYYPPAGCGTAAHVKEIITRLRQAEKDAARYRWLRDDYRHEYCVDDLFDGSSSSVDNRIDEAMQCSK